MIDQRLAVGNGAGDVRAAAELNAEEQVDRVGELIADVGDRCVEEDEAGVQRGQRREDGCGGEREARGLLEQAAAAGHGEELRHCRRGRDGACVSGVHPAPEDDLFRLLALGEQQLYVEDVITLFKKSRRVRTLFVGGGGFISVQRDRRVGTAPSVVGYDLDRVEQWRRPIDRRA